MSNPLFQHRQYVWLAAFARDNLTEDQRVKLAAELRGTNPAYNRTRFEDAAGVDGAEPAGRDRVR
jgi:hypothetical protein